MQLYSSYWQWYKFMFKQTSTTMRSLLVQNVEKRVSSGTVLFQIEYGTIRRWSLRADHASQLSASDVFWARQGSALNFDRVDHRLVFVCCAVGCNFRCLVPAQVGATPSLAVRGSMRLGHQVPGVLGRPTVRARRSCRNHKGRWPTSRVADRTRSRLLEQISPTVVAGVEDAVPMGRITPQPVLHTLDESGSFLCVIAFQERLPLRVFGQTEVVAAVTSLTPMRPCCVTFEQTQCMKLQDYMQSRLKVCTHKVAFSRQEWPRIVETV